MLTAGEKKRLFWVLAMIFFFFANLIVGTILVFHWMEAKPAARAPATSAPAAAVGTQP